MNETFEKYDFPCSVSQQVFVSRNKEKENDQTLAIQMKIKLPEEPPKDEQS